MHIRAGTELLISFMDLSFDTNIFLSRYNKLEENLKIKYKIHIATEYCQSFNTFTKRNCEISLEAQRKELHELLRFKRFVRSPYDDSVGVQTCSYVQEVFRFGKELCFIDASHIYLLLLLSVFGLVWAGTRAQSGDRYGSGMLHPGQVLRGSLPLLSPSPIFILNRRILNTIAGYSHVEGRIILRWIFRRWTESSWLKIGTGSGHL